MSSRQSKKQRITLRQFHKSMVGEYMDERAVRLQKINDLAAVGVPAFSDNTSRTHTIEQSLDAFDQLRDAESEITLCGRLMSLRWHGGSAFADLRDGTERIQLYLRRDILGEKEYTEAKNYLDHADIVEVRGKLMVTKVGERTLEVLQLQLLAKALLPLPEKWHGLQDVETRYRQRELDLLVNPDVRERFIIRSKLVSGFRQFLSDRGFVEVETPMLQPIPGGANARPFATHHNALNIDLYLRIAPELYLKRLIVGGFEKVYEMGRCFRNEGIDYAHNPEFTMLELYWAYVSEENFIRFIEELVVYAVTAALGNAGNFETPWPRKTFVEAIQEVTGIDINRCPDEASLIAAVKEKNIAVDFSGCVGWGEYCDEIFKKTARVKIIQPTWIFDYPRALKPLAKKSPRDETKSASVQLVVAGAEIVNAYYHELNDPVDQRNALMQQQLLRDQGSAEAQWLDEDFLRALEHGMPPTGGFGIGIDRLASLITDVANLKEVILFPTLKPETHADDNNA